jgi:hypothetical protein
MDEVRGDVNRAVASERGRQSIAIEGRTDSQSNTGLIEGRCLYVACIRTNRARPVNCGDGREFLPSSRKEGASPDIDGIPEKIPLGKITGSDRSSWMRFRKAREDQRHDRLVAEQVLDG